MAKPGTVYEPLEKVRKELKVKWVRPAIDRDKLQELNRRSDAQGWFQAGGHLLIWLLTGTAVYYSWARQSWLLFLIALFLHGTVASFFVGIAPHELGHGTVFKTKILNQIFLYIYSCLGWWDHYDYAASHTYHHRYTLHPEGDRENLLPISPMVGPFFLVQLLTINIFTQPGRTFGKGGFISTVYVTALGAFGLFGSIKIPVNEWLRALHADQPEMRQDAIWWDRFLLIFHGVVILASLLTGYWVFIFIISLSPFIANWGVYMLGMTQHTGLKENDNDFRKATRSVKTNFIWEFLYWRMNWHTEHHMFAGIPCYNLKALYHEIADQMPEPRTLLGAWREMRETWDKQQEDPDYYFDTPVPPVKQDIKKSRRADDLESSIGDLAPKGLQ
ncbi:MAG: fatty acid desaturase [Ardenticatenaceae bacterium]|nr:fatty acid desaturase [Ardenticatenaceae bacterium]